MDQFLEFFNITGPVALVLLGAYIILNIVGEVSEKLGKTVPAFMKLITAAKARRKKKREKEDAQIKTAETLTRVEALLNDVNAHYSADNIAKRDSWMQWVNDRACVYDDSIKLLQEQFKENTEITVDLYINFNRNRILDFASRVADDNALASREEFNRIFKINRDYHEMLGKYGKENGEVDTAIKIIEEAYEYRMKHHSFIEDIRGYN